MSDDGRRCTCPRCAMLHELGAVMQRHLAADAGRELKASDACDVLMELLAEIVTQAPTPAVGNKIVEAAGTLLSLHVAARRGPSAAARLH